MRRRALLTLLGTAGSRSRRSPTGSSATWPHERQRIATKKPTRRSATRAAYSGIILGDRVFSYSETLTSAGALPDVFLNRGMANLGLPAVGGIA
jgi:hypothetical protein